MYVFYLPLLAMVQSLSLLPWNRTEKVWQFTASVALITGAKYWHAIKRNEREREMMKLQSGGPFSSVLVLVALLYCIYCLSETRTTRLYLLVIWYKLSNLSGHRFEGNESYLCIWSLSSESASLMYLVLMQAYNGWIYTLNYLVHILIFMVGLLTDWLRP